MSWVIWKEEDSKVVGGRTEEEEEKPGEDGIGARVDPSRRSIDSGGEGDATTALEEVGSLGNRVLGMKEEEVLVP